ncbi:MAG TPA: AraC family transcriptional regulator [Bryobacteraceae bacterium]|nr:AraC family transcriptional regulator [Bryobacteraceae bacterium]
MAGGEETRIILVGAEDPLPSEHFWFEGEGYWIYAAEQPRSAWREHTHDCAQVTIGLEPAHVHAEWRTGATRSPNHRELTGNAVSIIPPGVPHRTLWRRRAALIHIYLSTQFLSNIARRILRVSSFELRPAHLVRDPFIEESGRALYRECETRNLSAFFADSMATVLTTHVLRTYDASPDSEPNLRGGLGPARERRIREYIEQSLERDLSIEALAGIAGLSPHYFADLFRQSTGFTPHQYVSHRRVERARQLLADPDLPLTEVAYRCGFTSQSQFTTVFRRFAGATPGRIRAEFTTDKMLPSIDEGERP